MIFCFLLFFFIVSTFALRSTLTIENDERHMFHIQSFGFGEKGRFDITVKNLRFHGRPTNFEDYGFILENAAAERKIRDLTKTCFKDEAQNLSSCQIFPESENDTLCSNSADVCFHYTKQITKPGNYHLYFSNCKNDTYSWISFQLTLIEYNIDARGKISYLGVGEESIPFWLVIFTFFFTALAVIWFVLLWKQWSEVKHVHLLMGVVLILKILSLLFEAFRYHSLNSLGVHDGWTIAFYVFSFLKGMLLFVTIVLIGTGWSYLKPFLSDRDKRLVLIVLVVQFMVNIAMVVLDEMNPGSHEFINWRDLLVLLDMICCCLILLPIVSSIRHLQSAQNADGQAQRNLQRLQIFRTFYMATIAYIYFSRIVFFLLSNTLSFRLLYISTVFRESANGFFYVGTGYLFRPQPRHPYLAIDESEEQSLTSVVGETEMTETKGNKRQQQSEDGELSSQQQ